MKPYLNKMRYYLISVLVCGIAITTAKFILTKLAGYVVTITLNPASIWELMYIIIYVGILALAILNYNTD